MRDAKCLIPSLRDLAMMQASWFEVEVKVKRRQVSGASTAHSKDWSAIIGQSGDPGMRRTGRTRAVSPACRVFVLVTVRKAPELLKVTLPRDSRVNKEPDLLCRRM